MYDTDLDQQIDQFLVERWDQPSESTRRRASPAFDRACAFLLNYLMAEEQHLALSRDIKDAAGRIGITETTLDKARTTLGIESLKNSKAKGQEWATTFWCLPGQLALLKIARQALGG
jgi:hypothetical protein